MGVTGHLQFQKSLPANPRAKNAVILFETKTWIPFAWSLFFVPEDLQPFEGEKLLVAPSRLAVSRARAHLKALRKVAAKRLLALLEHFVVSVEAAGEGFLVLDPYRLNSGEEELTSPLKWLASLGDAEPEEWLAAGAELYSDDDEGLHWEGVKEDDEDEPELDYFEKDRVTGWPISAKKVAWYEEDDE